MAAEKKAQSNEIYLDITQEQLEKMTPEELDIAIKRVELQTKVQTLRREQQSNQDFLEKERRRHDANTKRQAELEEGRRNHEATTQVCKHRSGGTPQNLLKGGGRNSFSILYRLVLPDGHSIVVMCPRCRLKAYPPTEALKKSDPKQYAADLARYTKLLEQSREEGLEFAESRGATFMFKTAQGVPVIPERV